MWAKFVPGSEALLTQETRVFFACCKTVTYSFTKGVSGSRFRIQVLVESTFKVADRVIHLLHVLVLIVFVNDEVRGRRRFAVSRHDAVVVVTGLALHTQSRNGRTRAFRFFLFNFSTWLSDLCAFRTKRSACAMLVTSRIHTKLRLMPRAASIYKNTARSKAAPKIGSASWPSKPFVSRTSSVAFVDYKKYCTFSNSSKQTEPIQHEIEDTLMDGEEIPLVESHWDEYERDLRTRLVDRLQATSVEIHDRTRPGCDIGLEIHVSAPGFAGVSKVEQNRMVMAALQGLLDDVHSLTIKTKPSS